MLLLHLIHHSPGRSCYCAATWPGLPAASLNPVHMPDPRTLAIAVAPVFQIPVPCSCTWDTGATTAVDSQHPRTCSHHPSMNACTPDFCFVSVPCVLRHQTPVLPLPTGPSILSATRSSWQKKRSADAQKHSPLKTPTFPTAIVATCSWGLLPSLPALTPAGGGALRLHCWACSVTGTNMPQLSHAPTGRWKSSPPKSVYKV